MSKPKWEKPYDGGKVINPHAHAFKPPAPLSDEEKSQRKRDNDALLERSAQLHIDAIKTKRLALGKTGKSMAEIVHAMRLRMKGS